MKTCRSQSHVTSELASVHNGGPNKRACDMNLQYYKLSEPRLRLEKDTNSE